MADYSYTGDRRNNHKDNTGLFRTIHLENKIYKHTVAESKYYHSLRETYIDDIQGIFLYCDTGLICG